MMAWVGAAAWASEALAAVLVPSPSAATEVTRMRANCCCPPVANVMRLASMPRIAATVSTRMQALIWAQAAHATMAIRPIRA